LTFLCEFFVALLHLLFEHGDATPRFGLANRLPSVQ
jgi:hypothetical protein